jgi:hypothetical protein
MVVVDNARRLIGKNVDMTVTSVLQTTAGKMIFGRIEESRPEPRDGREPREAREPREVRQPRPSASAVES